MTWSGVLGGVLRRKEEVNPKEDNKKGPGEEREGKKGK